MDLRAGGSQTEDQGVAKLAREADMIVKFQQPGRMRSPTRGLLARLPGWH